MLPVVLGPVGPAPLSLAARVPKGYLQIYTETETVQEGDNMYYYPHTDCSACANNGTLVTRVRSAIGRRDGNPAVAALPVGIYHVKALGLLVPVIIQRGKMTMVHLDGDWRPDRPREEIEDEDLVQTARDGAIGWRGK